MLSFVLWIRERSVAFAGDGGNPLPQILEDGHVRGQERRPPLPRDVKMSCAMVCGDIGNNVVRYCFSGFGVLDQPM